MLSIGMFRSLRSITISSRENEGRPEHLLIACDCRGRPLKVRRPAGKPLPLRLREKVRYGDVRSSENALTIHEQRVWEIRSFTLLFR